MQPLMVYNMSCFICPVCKSELSLSGKTYTCPNRHSFDVSKDGYVNLLMSQKSSQKRHGDDKFMVRCRRDFLEKGFYEKLCEGICDAVKSAVAENGVIADIGCGEGYYTGAVARCGDYTVCGIDISKNALKYASKLLKNSEFAVASAFSLPFFDKSADCVLSVFAPSCYEEFHRVLKDGGVLIKAVPLEEHLWELKCALYDKPYKNKAEIRNEELFKLRSVNEIKYEINLDSNEDIMNLFGMTPYYYKTGRAETEKLLKKTALTTTVHFGVEIYEKR